MQKQKVAKTFIWIRALRGFIFWILRAFVLGMTNLYAVIARRCKRRSNLFFYFVDCHESLRDSRNDEVGRIWVALRESAIRLAMTKESGLFLFKLKPESHNLAQKANRIFIDNSRILSFYPLFVFLHRGFVSANNMCFLAPASTPKCKFH